MLWRISCEFVRRAWWAVEKHLSDGGRRKGGGKEASQVAARRRGGEGRRYNYPKIAFANGRTNPLVGCCEERGGGPAGFLLLPPLVERLNSHKTSLRDTTKKKERKELELAREKEER